MPLPPCRAAYDHALAAIGVHMPILDARRDILKVPEGGRWANCRLQALPGGLRLAWCSSTPWHADTNHSVLPTSLRSRQSVQGLGRGSFGTVRTRAPCLNHSVLASTQAFEQGCRAATCCTTAAAARAQVEAARLQPGGEWVAVKSLAAHVIEDTVGGVTAGIADIQMPMLLHVHEIWWVAGPPAWRLCAD